MVEFELFAAIRDISSVRDRSFGYGTHHSVDIQREKRVEVALTYIYGIGRTRSSDICEALNIGRATHVTTSLMKK